MLPIEKLLEVRCKYLETMEGPPLRRAEVTDSRLRPCISRTKEARHHLQILAFGDHTVRGQRGCANLPPTSLTPMGLRSLLRWLVHHPWKCGETHWRSSVRQPSSTTSPDQRHTMITLPASKNGVVGFHVPGRSAHRQTSGADLNTEKKIYRRQTEWHCAQPGYSPYDSFATLEHRVPRSCRRGQVSDEGAHESSAPLHTGSSFVDQQLEQEQGQPPFKKQKGSRANQDDTSRDEELWNHRDSSTGLFKHSMSKVEICSNWNNSGCVDGESSNRKHLYRASRKAWAVLALECIPEMSLVCSVPSTEWLRRAPATVNCVYGMRAPVAVLLGRICVVALQVLDVYCYSAQIGAQKARCR